MGRFTFLTGVKPSKLSNYTLSGGDVNPSFFISGIQSKIPFSARLLLPEMVDDWVQNG